MLSITNALRARGIGVGKKLTGDALPGDLRAGKKAMNADGEFTGTVPVQTGGDVIPGTADIVKQPGIYDTPITVKAVAGLTAGVIKAGTTVGGVLGTFTSDANAVAGDVLNTKIVYVNGVKVIGTMVDRGTVNYTPSNVDQIVAGGKHSGVGKVLAVPVDASKVLTGTTIANTPGTLPNNGAGGTVTPSTTNQSKPAGYYSSTITITGDPDLIAGNILSGKNIFGVAGTVSPKLNATGTISSMTDGELRTINTSFTIRCFAVYAEYGGNLYGSTIIASGFAGSQEVYEIQTSMSGSTGTIVANRSDGLRNIRWEAWG